MAKNKQAVLAVFNVTWRLLVICLAVAALVALVFEITKGPIAEGEITRKKEAVRAIFPESDTMEEGKTQLKDSRVNVVYDVADADGIFIGWCVDYVGTSEYGGDVSMMIGVDPNGKVVGLQVISHAETFIDRYTDDKGMYTGIGLPYGVDISAGATMSYNAVRNAITAVEELFADLVKVVPPVTDEPGEAEDDPALQSAFSEAEVTMFFDNVASFSEPSVAFNSPVRAVCVVKDDEADVLGHCIKISAGGGRNGRIELLVARADSGDVIGVQVLEHYENSMEFYVDENGCFDLAQDVQVGATVTYDAIRAAVAVVKNMDLGGAV